MPGPFSSSEAQKSLEQNHALLHKERGYRQWMKTNLKGEKSKKAFRRSEASPELLRQVQEENVILKKRGIWLTIARLGTALMLMAALWYGLPPLLQWLFPALW